MTVSKITGLKKLFADFKIVPTVDCNKYSTALNIISKNKIVLKS
tara:strand:+ start:388 stop:519 length:132 start_codon:yes stop_codon:yes gene_type:complete